MSRMTARMKKRAGPGPSLLGAWLLVLLALATAVGLPAAAHAFQLPARTITNVATLDWDSGAQPRQLSSNRVDLTVVAPPPRSPVLIRVQNYLSQDTAIEGELVQYRIVVQNSDPAQASGAISIATQLPEGLRLRSDSLRFEGAPVSLAEPGTLTARSVGLATTPRASVSGRVLTVRAPAVASGGSVTLSFVLEVIPGARDGDAIVQSVVDDEFGNRSNQVDAVLRIRRDAIFDALTIIGRVTDGGCDGDAAARGLAGVRVMLEDGSYAVTDHEGRYHFQGVEPGLHVVQVDQATLPPDRAIAQCRVTTRSAGRAASRFVEGQGGTLQRVDFHTVETTPGRARSARPAPRATPPSDAAAAGAERQWLEGQQPGIGFLFPEPDHNPRARAVRVAIRHHPGQSVRLLVNGVEADALAFEGATRNAAGTVSVSLWRGIPLEERETRLTAEVRNADGSVAETLHRVVHYSGAPIRAELLRDRSVLVADGVARPVIALRLTDRDGRPVRHGVTGDFEVPAPYYPAVEADAQQARQLAGLERARPYWRVEGDDGIAYVELEPTTASGTLSLRFDFRDGTVRRNQRVEAWLDPGDRPWTIVGLAAGTVGFNRLRGRMEDLARRGDVLTDGRLALYATGRIRGRWLMTLAYDSDRREREARFGGTIDPNAYYTVYADRSERRFGAASTRRLYLRLERPQFYALFGDFETGIDEPELTRYVRAFNGLRAEYRSDRFGAIAFAADAPNRHGHEEIQGNGLSRPYLLNASPLLANSERISIEVRDRLRADRIVERRIMTRHIDYDIDYQTGSLRFREPILSRSSAGDPQFIIVDYEVPGTTGRSLNAGGRVSWRDRSQQLQVAATVIHDASDVRRTDLAGVDVRYRPSADTEIRAEAAASDSRTGGASRTASAWLVEAEHHGARYDLLAYAREREAGFGVGQLNAAENGTRRFGIDGRLSLSEHWTLSGSAWREDYLGSVAGRTAARALLEYRAPTLSGRLGFVFADDRLPDGRKGTSTRLVMGASRRFLDNRLELDAQSEIAFGSNAESVDFPSRYRFTARYAVSSAVQLVGAYEITDGEQVDSRTLRVGFDLRPWAGARIALTANRQDIAEYGPRSFAAFGLSQSVVAGPHWSFDFTVDGNKSLGGPDASQVLSPFHPVSGGGFLGSGGLTEDFLAVTAGATYRRDRWSVTGRAEYRDGEDGDRYGFTAAALRQIGEGRAIGGAIEYFSARGQGGVETRVAGAQLSWAHRPAGSAWSWLNRLEAREDVVLDAVAGQPGPLGRPLLVDGDARSRRIVNSLSLNWSPARGPIEIAAYWGLRYADTRLGADDIGGWSTILGADARLDLSSRFDIGVSATVRRGIGGRSSSYAFGPSIGFSPVDNGWLSIGWNFAGFEDRDFGAERRTNSGPYATFRFRFDQLSLQALGIGRR